MITQFLSGKMKRKEASHLLGVGERAVSRMAKRIEVKGIMGSVVDFSFRDETKKQLRTKALPRPAKPRKVTKAAVYVTALVNFKMLSYLSFGESIFSSFPKKSSLAFVLTNSTFNSFNSAELSLFFIFGWCGL